MTLPARRRRRRLPRLLVAAVVAIGVLGIVGTAAVYFDVAGSRGRAGRLVARVELFLDPPPDRPVGDVVITPRPSLVATPTPTLAPGETAPPTPSPTTAPKRTATDVNLISDDPSDHFITEIDHEWCAVAATQIVMAMHGKAPLTHEFQQRLAARIGEWDSLRDSKN